MNYLDLWNKWRTFPTMPKALLEQLNAMADDTDAIRGAFGAELQFGTAGLRGIMGPGPNRLNIYTVRRTALGMAAWLNRTDLPKRCAIGYDSRHHSRLFAEVCACAFAEHGIEVYLYHELAPTPMLSFAVRQMECGCGIVISASHNSGEYNGVKCYGSDGCQLTDAPAAVVMEQIKGIAALTEEEKPFAQWMAEGQIKLLPLELWERYYQTVLAEGLRLSEVPDAQLQVIYTPLCGTGNKPVREILKRIGVQTTVVACQELPDGDFKTCEYPNPETDDALQESYRLAKSHPCDLIMGTDPDCDRIAVAIPVKDGFRKLSGNELGCLLLDYILRTMTQRGNMPEGAFAVRSIVTTSMADRICEKYGCEMRTVLIGFKWIGGEILKEEQNGQEAGFVFAFEESCGYLKGTYARDKDAVVASMLVAEMAAWYKKQGMNLADAIDALYKEYGYVLSSVFSCELTGVDAMEKAALLMQRLRENSPACIGGMCVESVLDYQAGTMRELESGAASALTLPKSNVLEFRLGDSGRVIVRPSGTEPKVKFYLTALADSHEAAARQLCLLAEDMQRFVPENE